MQKIRGSAKITTMYKTNQTKVKKQKSFSLVKKILTALQCGKPINFIMKPQTKGKGFVKKINWQKLREEKIDEGYLKNQIYHLRRKKLIEFKEIGNITKIVLSEQGKKYVLKYDYDNLKIHKHRFWDGKWRLVMFDIPENKKRARDAMREKIKELGLVKFNDSVWIYPYSCRREIDFVAEFWQIGKYVNYAKVVSITNQHYLKKVFKLQ